MDSKTAIFWFGKRNLIQKAIEKAKGQAGIIYHGFIETTSRDIAPIITLYGERGEITVKLTWDEIGGNPFERHDDRMYF